MNYPPSYSNPSIHLRQDELPSGTHLLSVDDIAVKRPDGSNPLTLPVRIHRITTYFLLQTLPKDSETMESSGAASGPQDDGGPEYFKGEDAWEGGSLMRADGDEKGR